MPNVEVYDDAGRKQIVDDPIDMTLVKKSLATSSNISITEGKYYNVFHADPIPKYEAIRAYQPNPDPIFANKGFSSFFSDDMDVPAGYPHSQAGKGFGFTVYTNPVNVYYYTWLPQPKVSTLNLGLEVFNSEGELSWASYNTSMNIIDIIKAKDFRYAVPDLNNFYVKDYGHKDIAVIPIKTPFYLENNIEYNVGFTFNENGALRIYRNLHYKLTSGEIAQGWDTTLGYELEVLVVDIRNAKFL